MLFFGSVDDSSVCGRMRPLLFFDAVVLRLGIGEKAVVEAA